MGGSLYFYGKHSNFYNINNENLSQRLNQNSENFLNAITFPIFKDHFIRNIFLGDDFAVILAGKFDYFNKTHDF